MRDFQNVNGETMRDYFAYGISTFGASVLFTSRVPYMYAGQVSNLEGITAGPLYSHAVIPETLRCM
jgi:hypothetical protein